MPSQIQTPFSRVKNRGGAPGDGRRVVDRGASRASSRRGLGVGRVGGQVGPLVRVGRGGRTAPRSRRRSGCSASRSVRTAWLPWLCVVIAGQGARGGRRPSTAARGCGLPGLRARQAARVRRGSGRGRAARRARRNAPPAATPGPAKISGTRVDRSQSVFLPVIPFSPRCQPWSDQSTTMVSSGLAARLERVEHAADLAVHEADAREVGADERRATGRPCGATTAGARGASSAGTRRTRARRRGRRPSPAALQRLVRDRGRTTSARRSRGRAAAGSRPRRRTACPAGSACSRAIAASAIFQSAWSSSRLGEDAPVHGPDRRRASRRTSWAGSGMPAACPQTWNSSCAVRRGGIDAVVEDLARAERRVAVRREGLRERDAVLERGDVAESRRERRRRRWSTAAGPVSTLVRDGLQSGAWQWALVKSVPRRASASMFGVFACGMAAEAADPVVQVVDRDEQDVRRPIRRRRLGLALGRSGGRGRRAGQGGREGG